MAIKTDELQRASAPKSTDTLLMASCTDTDASGTAQLSLADLGRFLVGQDNAVRTALYDKADAKAPEWYDLVLLESFLPDGENAVNQYCKDCFGRVTVRLQCRTSDAEGIASEKNIGILPSGFRPRGGSARTFLFRADRLWEIGYVHFYPSGSFASGVLTNGEPLKQIDLEVSFCADDRSAAQE